MSIVTSPSGAVLCLFHERDEAEAEPPPGGPGSRHWTELHSLDVDADVAWLTAAFGFDVEAMAIEGGGTYHVLKAGGQPRAARLDGPFDGGARLTGPSDWPGVGRMAMLHDPTGAVFGVIRPEG